MNEEFVYFQKMWNKKLKVPAFSAYKTTKMDYNNFEGGLKKMYENVTKEVMEKIVEVYKWDFELFGYDPKPFLNKTF